MGSAVNWTSEIEEIAGEFRPRDTRDSWLGRAFKPVSDIYKKLDQEREFTFRHFKSLFYGHTRDPRYTVAYSVLSAAEQARKQKAKDDAALAAGYLHRRAVALSNIDPDFHGEEIMALRTIAAAIGRADRSERTGEDR